MRNRLNPGQITVAVYSKGLGKLDLKQRTTEAEHLDRSRVLPLNYSVPIL